MKQVLWALDPFETEAKPSAEFLHQVKEWLRQSQMELQPVYILSIPREEQPAAQIPGRREFLENAAREHVEGLGFSEAKPLQILFDGEADWKNATRKMADFARRQEAACIMVNSRGHSGLQNMLFGSFTTNLLPESPAPLFFLSQAGEEGARPAPFAKVLFATDFCDYSHAAFTRFLEIAKPSGFEILIFHAISFPAVSALGTGFGAEVGESYFTDQENWARARADEWIQEAEARGVQAGLILVDTGFDTDTAAQILRAACENEVGFVALASATHEKSAIGKIVTEICHKRSLPVWVYGPRSIPPSARMESAAISEREQSAQK